MQVEIMEKRFSGSLQDRLSGKGRTQNIYTISSTENLINDLIENHGYEMIQLSEGCLGLGDCVMIAPDDKHYNFVIREVYVNSWTSGQTIRKCRKISKALQAEIDKALDEADE